VLLKAFGRKRHSQSAAAFNCGEANADAGS
jgi:hypothetical protein